MQVSRANAQSPDSEGLGWVQAIFISDRCSGWSGKEHLPWVTDVQIMKSGYGLQPTCVLKVTALRS